MQYKARFTPAMSIPLCLVIDQTSNLMVCRDGFFLSTFNQLKWRTEFSNTTTAGQCALRSSTIGIVTPQ